MALELKTGLEPLQGYTLIDRLGKGGFGEVWKAEAPGGFKVALKFVPLEEASSRVELRSLNVIKDIRHANLLSTFGSWQLENMLVIAMELGDCTLMDRYKQCSDEGMPGIPGQELVEYFYEAAKGIDYLNEPRHVSDSGEKLGVQHRDIKPQNLLLAGGSVKVADFGLAKVLQHSVSAHTGSLTLSYAAPEFFSGQTSHHSDQYCLAITYCHLRCGQLPFKGNAAEIMAGHLMHEPDLTGLPEEERPVVARALSKEPKDRWDNCREFIRALRKSQTGKEPSFSGLTAPADLATGGPVKAATVAPTGEWKPEAQQAAVATMIPSSSTMEAAAQETDYAAAATSDTGKDTPRAASWRNAPSKPARSAGIWIIPVLLVLLLGGGGAGLWFSGIIPDLLAQKDPPKPDQDKDLNEHKPDPIPDKNTDPPPKRAFAIKGNTEYEVVAGGSIKVPLEITRENLDGAITLASPTLNPGISLHLNNVPPGENSAEIQVQVGEGVNPGPAPVEIIGKSEEIEFTFKFTLKISRKPVPVAKGDFNLVATDRITLKPGENKSIDVEVARKNDLNGPIKLFADGLPASSGLEVALTTIPANENRAQLSIKVADGAPPGRQKVTLAAVGGDVKKSIQLEVVVAKLPKVTIQVVGPAEWKPGPQELKVRINRDGLEGPLRVLVPDQPNGVEIKEADVPAGSSESVLSVTVGESAVGSEPQRQSARLVVLKDDRQLTEQPFDIVLQPIPVGEVTLLAGHTSDVKSVAVSPDGQTALSGGEDNSIRYWDLTTGKELAKWNDHDDVVNGVAFSPDSTRAATGGDDNFVRLWDLNSRTQVSAFQAEHVEFVSAVRFSPDGQRILAGDWNNHIILRNATSGAEIKSMRGHSQMVLDAAFLPKGERAVSAGYDHVVILWDLETGSEIRRFRGDRSPGNSSGFHCVAATDSLILAGSWDGAIYVWDIEKESLVRKLTGHNGTILSIALSPDGRQLISGGEDGTVRLWDVNEGRELHQFTGHKGSVNGVAFFPNGQRILSGGQDKTIRIWRLPGL